MGFMDSQVMAAELRCTSFRQVDGFSFSEIPLTYGLIHREGKLLSGGANRFIELCGAYDFSPANAP